MRLHLIGGLSHLWHAWPWRARVLLRSARLGSTERGSLHSRIASLLGCAPLGTRLHKRTTQVSSLPAMSNAHPVQLTYEKFCMTLH